MILQNFLKTVIIKQYISEKKTYENMSNRVTIVIDDELMKKLRKKQAAMIQKTSKNVSFSKLITEYLEKSL